jgi:hypothetical protein
VPEAAEVTGIELEPAELAVLDKAIIAKHLAVVDLLKLA